MALYNNNKLILIIIYKILFFPFSCKRGKLNHKLIFVFVNINNNVGKFDPPDPSRYYSRESYQFPDVCA